MEPFRTGTTTARRTQQTNKTQNCMKTTKTTKTTNKTFAVLTALGIGAAAQSHAAVVIANAQELTITGGIFTAGTSPTGRWYGGGDGSSATGGNPGQFVKGAPFDELRFSFVTLPAPLASEPWKITYDFIGQQNWKNNNSIYVLGLTAGTSISTVASLTGPGVTVINLTTLGAVAAWTSYAPANFNIPAGLSAVAIGIRGDNDPAVFGLDNLNVTAIPEPSNMALLGLGAAGLLVRRRRI